MTSIVSPRRGSGHKAHQNSDEMIQQKLISVPSAEILTLYSSPIEVVRAQGTKKVIEFLGAVCFLDHGGTDYAAGGVFNFMLGSTPGTNVVSDDVAAADFINSAADAYRVVQPLSADTALVANTALYVANETAVHTTGDGELKILLSYRIVDFNF